MLNRNMQPVWYCLFDHDEPVLDEYGNEIGRRVIYGPATQTDVVQSPAAGEASVEWFGTFSAYDKAIMTSDLSCPIDENSVLFVDKEPEFDGDGSPLYDYQVRKVAKSLNFVMFALSKVVVS